MTDATPSIREGRESPPSGLRFHPGHTWVRLLSLDLAFVGVTDFAVNFTGTVAGISLPREFRLLRLGQEAWVLSSGRGRRLTQVSPIGGQILAVNSDLLEDPAGLARSPYHHAWLLCLQSVTIPEQMRKLLAHEADQIWLARTRSTMISVLGSPLRLPLEGNQWEPAFGDELGDEEWEALRQKLFPACRQRSLQGDPSC